MVPKVLIVYAVRAVGAAPMESLFTFTASNKYECWFYQNNINDLQGSGLLSIFLV